MHIDDTVTSDGDHTWSPPSSPWMWKRQQAVTASKLSLRNGLLRWNPVGIPAKAPGGIPFQAQVGPRPGQVQELVWVSGTVAIGARGGSIEAGAVAVCTKDPSAPGGRRVLGYLSEALLALPMGEVAVPEPDSARARGQAIATVIGVPFTVHEVDLGEDPNVLFPGVMRYGRFGKNMAWLPGLLYLPFGALIAGGAGYQVGQGQLGALLLVAFGLLMFGLGVLTLPPVSNRMRKRFAKRSRRGAGTPGADGGAAG